ncbi:hypothetical protein C8F04DRAFT_79573 [Mycena alexandri]|uniref:Uncharacterized protein n=1 Tax=Mycena alexandri TaxID=1745969 RepID=A0AAD6TAE7_9AGAR|nr:hypothetical protein C8F04DRAFT_79573 [Mycena alexandri]
MALPAHTTLIIAVSAGCVGGLLLLFILYRVLLRRPAKQQVPLPPKQELARYREHQIQVADSRPPTWYDSGSLSAPPSRTFTASKSSLLPPDSRGGSPFRRASLNTSESPSEDISNFVPMVPTLHHPHSFDTSSSSLSTAETGESPTSPLASTNDSLPRPRPTSSSRSSRNNNRRPRPLSVGSNVSAAVSRNSRHSIRGVPHGPHSQVQIVLPAPLAFNDRMSNHEPSARLSVVDQWAPMAVRSEGNLIPRPQRRSVSNSDAPSQSSLSQPPINAQQARRAVSASSSAPQLAQPPPDYRNYSQTSSFSPPPVPQIPQQWLPPSGDGILGIADAGRGRSRDNVALVNERPPQPADRPPPPLEGQRKLQKQSISTGR